MEENYDNTSYKRGYLNEDFQLFHIKDKKNMKFEFHYHDFNKIIIFLSGKVTYLIEGKAYNLKPWDILLIGSSEVHKPIIESTEEYERVVIWINSKFLIKHNNEECDLLTCFYLAAKRKINLLRLNKEMLRGVQYTLENLERSYSGNDFGSHILKNALFIELIVYINRLFLGTENIIESKDVVYDEKIEGILEYINENLSNELSIEIISSKFYISKYHLMHKFKEQTGYTIHNYILHKRLFMANSLIKQGDSLMEVCNLCGFGDYSNFVRAFKKMFGMSPKKYYKALTTFQK